VDIAAALLARAREHRAAARIDNVEFLHADVQSSDLGRAQFDGASPVLALCSSTIQCRRLATFASP
jgi:ubiquinone/menaquinone biosynthesis C-methylase UbiE